MKGVVWPAVAGNVSWSLLRVFLDARKRAWPERAAHAGFLAAIACYAFCDSWTFAQPE